MKVEKISNYEGYDYLIILGQLGFRCGYVRIPKTSSMFGLEYNKNSIIFDGKSIDEMFDVHGGVTFTGELHPNSRPGFESEDWFMGFDCGHLGDSPEPDHDPYGLGKMGNGVVRDMLYVERELMQLIGQIIQFEGE